MLDLFGKVPQKQNPQSPQRPVINRQSKTYDEKLAEEQYELFTSRDVVEHFERYYMKTFGKQKDFNRDGAVRIVEELFQEGFSADTLTLYIEFIFESDQTCIDKLKFGMGTFKIDKFVDYIEANLDAFQNGESIQAKVKKNSFKDTINRQREWSRDVAGRVKFETNRFF